MIHYVRPRHKEWHGYELQSNGQVAYPTFDKPVYEQIIKQYNERYGIEYRNLRAVHKYARGAKTNDRTSNLPVKRQIVNKAVLRIDYAERRREELYYAHHRVYNTRDNYNLAYLFQVMSCDYMSEYSA